LLGETVHFQGDLARSTALLEEGLTLQRQLGDHSGSCHTLYRLAETAGARGQHAQARVLHEESLALRRTLGDIRGMGASLKSLGIQALVQGDCDGAATRLKEALAKYQQIRLKPDMANCLEGLARVALARHRPRRAARLLGAVEAVLEQIGATLPWPASARFEQDRDRARAELGEHDFEAARSEGRAMSLEEAIAYALDDAA
jgi:non-specific serine/threonine protein kinase